MNPLFVTPASLRCALAGLCIATLSISTGAQSDEETKASAKRHFDAGTQLFEVENYKAAAIEFEASVKQYPTKNGYFNLANCYKALYRYRDALKMIDVLEAQFGDSLDDTMRQKTETLKTFMLSLTGEFKLTVTPPSSKVILDGVSLSSEELERPLKLGPGRHTFTVTHRGYQTEQREITVHSGSMDAMTITLSPQRGQLHITTNVAGVTVSVDGRTRGETPLSPLTLEIGEHTLTLTKAGYNHVSRTVAIAPSSKTVLEIALDRTPAASNAVRQEPVIPPLTTILSKQRLFPFKIAGLSGAILTAGLSVGFYGAAAKQASDFEKYDNAYVNAPTLAKATPWDHKRLDAQEKNSRYAALGLGFAIGAGVLTAATVTLVLLPRFKKQTIENPYEKQTIENPYVSVTAGSLTIRF